ncbi:MAG: phosphopantetheine-binding protein [Burkholderiaceae bacterium]|uniref:phosphopantetheine-binding protein n=1 Tax=Hydrogenophaga sp. TaxID=1904254 RepID=UPI00271AB428|nr:phosphopantetheine-binding protein [Hydrogenophaga sp.]MDO8278914.1 phosphopantetheine-binding protein [Burkholderiaceae bacterium]MDO9031044.1 phosphopantetheine-binding protein [Hydrogenophaga sp.]
MNDTPASSTLLAIKNIVARIKRKPELAHSLADTADLIDEVGLDSLEMLQFMLELEESLNILIDFDRLEFSSLRSIQQLAGLLDTMPRRMPATGAV